jgi:acyl-CoA thioesterase-1
LLSFSTFIIRLPVLHLLVVACGFAFSVSLHAQDRSSPRLLILGDSLSAAYGMAPEKGWVALLTRDLADRANIINASVSGETTEGGLQRLPGLLQELAPDVVVLELGGNDGLRGYPLSRIRNTLSEMITLSRESGAKILLVGMRIPPNYGRRYSLGFENIYPALAKGHELPLLPFLLEGIAGDATLMQNDGIHPNAQAQPAMAAKVGNALQPILMALEEKTRRVSHHE